MRRARTRAPSRRRPRRSTSGRCALPNPIVAASGTFGHGAELAALCDPSALGAVTAKSVAVFASEGNPPLRVTEAPGGGMLNSVGLPGPGRRRVDRHDLPALEAHGARVIASIWGRTVDEYERAARPLQGCRRPARRGRGQPVVPERRSARRRVRALRRNATRDATQVVVDALGGARAGVREALAERHRHRRDRDGARVDAGATGFTLVNTVMGLMIDAATRARRGSARAAADCRVRRSSRSRCARCGTSSRAHPGVPIIGTGGVTTGEDAAEMLLAGAHAVGVGTATFLDPRATLRIVDEMRDVVRAQRRAREFAI